MKDAYGNMRVPGESDNSFKKKFTPERSRQFDLIKTKEAAFKSVDDCVKQSSNLCVPTHNLKPSDGRVLHKHKQVKKLNGILGYHYVKNNMMMHFFRG